MQQTDYEKLGAFYLGRIWDPASGQLESAPLLYDAKDLTTHAVCVGMTGSGKTGLGMAVLEEAAIDGIPALIVDPKGDMGNLALTFPGLQPADFRPWVDPAAAARAGLDADGFAARTAAQWRQGIEEWGQQPERVARLRAAAEVVIYTPGSDAGRPISVLRSFDPPEDSELGDATALRERVNAAVAGLLGLLGLAADPLRSREHILLASLLDRAWREGRGLTLPELIAAIQKPPFTQVGVLDLETFYPAADRLALALALNNLLAAPGFDIWMQGEPLDIQRLLFTPRGQPRLAVLSLAHLSEAERMFFVTLLLNAVVSWMRRQSGTSSLRALLYMDEIFGFFPPSAMPPSKLPMLTLLKQARAYGLGVMLATQNPVDLDYKGLANAGTWFIGRLQTERDKLRVLDGLEGVLAGAGEVFDRARMDNLIAGLGSRTFLMRNVHDAQPLLFKSRWALSYLSGPMTPVQIRAVMAAHSVPASAAAAAPAAPRAENHPAAPEGAAPPQAQAAPSLQAASPALPPEVPEFHLAADMPDDAGLVWQPRLMGALKLHFVSARAGVDRWETRTLLAAVPEADEAEPWREAVAASGAGGSLPRGAPAVGRRAALPPAAGRARNYADWQKQLVSHAYQNLTLDLLTCPAVKRVSRPGESAGDFRAAVDLVLREKRDAEVEKIRARYAVKLAAAQDRLRRAGERSEREKGQLGQQKMQTVISFGAAILGAFMGRRVASVGNVGRAATAMRGAGRISREQGDVGRAAESVEVCRQRLAALEREIEEAVVKARESWDAGQVEVTEEAIRPRKSDISAGDVALVWTPWRQAPDGTLAPAFKWPAA